MPQRLLFVDDESTLLRSMDRAFGIDYEVDLAESGADAIEMLKGAAPYPVIVTDMRMPGMNGIEFIQGAREVAPDSVYIMLTGNQDIGTASKAVNDGEVYRFLNKPCEVEDLRRAIESGIRHHNLVHGEKELLHKTFVGAVSCVTGVLERAYPDLAGAGSTVGLVIGRLCEEVGIDDRWEFKLAGRLSLVGFALLGKDRSQMHVGIDPIAGEERLYWRAAAEASKLIAKIPRLETVANIIESFPTADGAICNLHPSSEGAIREVGASLLRIALQVHHAYYQGVNSKQMAEEIKTSLPNLQESVYEVLADLDPIVLENSGGIAIPMSQLNPGMVLSGNLESPAGGTLMRDGRRLDATTIEKIAEVFQYESSPSIEISTASYEAFSPMAV